MASCERKPTGRLVSSRPLWSDPRIFVQAWQNLPSETGEVQDLIRIAFSVDGSSWFLPWSKFVALVNDGNVTVGRNLTANRCGGNQLVVRYRQCHRLSAVPLTFCVGHDHEIVFGQVQVVEIIAKVNEARDEWARIFGGEFGGLPVPRLAFQQLVTEALRARGAFGSSTQPAETEDEDPWVRRDGLFDACGGPDQDPEPLDIAPSGGVKEPYEDESDDSEARKQAEQARRLAEENESAQRLRDDLIRRGLIKPAPAQADSANDGQPTNPSDTDQ